MIFIIIGIGVRTDFIFDVEDALTNRHGPEGYVRTFADRSKT